MMEEKSLAYESGCHSDKVFQMDWMVISPGVAIDSEIVSAAREKAMPVFGELEVASWFCPCPIIAITGSNGKSTVTSLIGEIFLKAQIPCVVAGNIGLSFSSLVLDADPKGVAVLEVSSFQLETIETFHPHIGVYLNLTPDHLDRHGTLDQYGKIKSRLFENQTSRDYAVLNGQDANVLRVADQVKSKVQLFGSKSKCCPHIYREQNQIFYCDINSLIPLIAVDQLGLPGIHNELNSMAAILAALIMGVDIESIQEAVQQFKGLPHRMEFVRESGGVKFYNDSKATNIDSVQFALQSFSTPVILIAGGKDKESEFSLLNDKIEKHVKAIVLIGESSDKMRQAWSALKPLHYAESLDEAVNLSRSLADAGDVVLLSPACASFDMFSNFEDRGNQFKEVVNAL